MYDHIDFAEKIDELKLEVGDRVLLFQDENDFEVTATLDYGYLDDLKRKVWFAVPDWPTLVKKQ